MLHVDVIEFMREATESAKSGRGDTPADLYAHLMNAQILYRGDFLDGFRIKAGAEFEDWMLFEQQRFREVFANVLLSLVDYHIDARQWAVATSFAQRLVQLNIYDDRANRALIELLARSGRRVEALQAYRNYEQVLKTEIGIEPGLALEELLDAIIDDRLDELRNNDDHGGGAQNPSLTISNLPAPLTGIIGRRAAIEEILRLLLAERPRLLTLTGPAGVGKTRLAIQALRSLRSIALEAAVFLPLASLRSPDLVLSIIAQAFDVEVTNQSELEMALYAVIGQRRILLILDNFEHVMPASLALSRLLRACPNLRALVTSREHLRIYGEHEISLIGASYSSTAGSAYTA